MDIVGILKSSYYDYGTIITDAWYYIFSSELRSNVSNVFLNFVNYYT